MAWDPNVPEGTRVIYENYTDEFGRPVRVTYFVEPDDTISGVHFH
jgi:hypothetical protein